MTKTEEELAVKKLREYLRIKTVHPKPDYASAIAFLVEYGHSIGLEVQVVKSTVENYDTVLMTWRGKDPSLTSILLNSHTDVVPIYEEYWKHDAFAAVKDENGDIYARGIQDMKSTGIQYLEAIRKLKDAGEQFDRDIHLSFVPDEEIGAEKGMQTFMKTVEFEQLNIGLVLDEGLASTDDAYTVFYGERNLWWIRVTCKGNPGHGSRFIENPAGEKMRRVMNIMSKFREEQKSKMENTCIPLGDVTTVNLTTLQGGIAFNIVPAELSATFDIRIPPSTDFVKFEEQLRSWCKEAGEDITMEFLQRRDDPTVTSTETPWWNTFTSAIKKFGVGFKVEIFSGATDSRFLRLAGYDAIGFSPMRNTPILLHDHNEFLNEKVFLEGIDAYCTIIPALANMKEKV